MLRTSLSNTLTQFYPLAGRVKGESSVDCNDKGVDYIETRVDSQLLNIIDRPELDVDAKTRGMSAPKEITFKYRRTHPERLVFSALTIAALKFEVVPYLAGIQPTRVEVVTALIWKKYGSIASTSMAFHPVNIRKRMVPALPEHCFGNLFLMANAVSNGEINLATLVTKLRVAIEKIDCDYVKERQGDDGFEVVMNDLKKIGELVSKGKVQVLRFSSWCGFPIYEADFG
ncbi:hypothetical protein TEA_003837 [Camellia sinensis var. sinensis]|uniref:Uncharacterized protein n=1 Tax=Camellia sinensis var. sinensis TaxID=542762 RepID=A0A4S4EV00_CAMSN|nr:hypothetical protein TEA_003837 [Camellia sinensis var. sinensis]